MTFSVSYPLLLAIVCLEGTFSNVTDGIVWQVDIGRVLKTVQKRISDGLYSEIPKINGAILPVLFRTEAIL